MGNLVYNKRKIINDPVFGFLNITSDLIYELMEHPWFQRLRRIKQLGLTYFVYPGATHNRFQHSIGSAHLMKAALEVLSAKSLDISEKEKEAAIIAIMLHDIGHGPFSHALENSIVNNINHEIISSLFIENLNKEFDDQLSLALEMFNNAYSRIFFHQLISGHLDMDRMDYLRRDSFFTGVVEGTIGSERIIKMLDVENDNLVVESKGIYSVEKFLIARRLMYWQVYLHKTVISAEFLLIKILQRAKFLAVRGSKLFASPYLNTFLTRKITDKKVFQDDKNLLNEFSFLDDSDIISSVKVWMKHEDKVLSFLAKSLINRRLFKIEISDKKFSKDKTEKIINQIAEKLGFSEEEANFIFCSDKFRNNAYSEEEGGIIIRYKNGEKKDIIEASELFDDSLLSKEIVRYFILYPKEVLLS
ncbi:HD domain-containing protein [Bacteroidota bacterium]